MTEPRPRERKGLRKSLQAGAIYDLALGLVIVVLGRPILAALGRPLPDHALFYFMLSALPLFILPVLYGAASRSAHIDGFRAPVLWARGGGGMLVLVCVWLFRPEPDWLFVGVGSVDLAWALLHDRLWRR